MGQFPRRGVLRSRVLILASIIAVFALIFGPAGTIAASPPPPAAVSALAGPPDLTNAARPVTPEERQRRAQASGSAQVVDLMLNNTDPSLATASYGGGTEPSIAINPLNPNQIVITSFYSGWGADAPLFYSTDGGQSWTVEYTIPQPPGVVGAPGCPCDQTVDYGRDGRLYGTFLLCCSEENVVTGSTTDPTSAATWKWLGNPVQYTDRVDQGYADQPWLIVNRDPVNASQDNVYVAYHDLWQNTAQMAVSYGASPVNVTVDQSPGQGAPTGTFAYTSIGHRPVPDPRNGTMYAIYQDFPAGNSTVKQITYRLNRSTDGGQTWSLNGSSQGIVIATVNSDQGQGYKFGGVNALLGGVDHAAVDPTTGDLYYVYGEDTAGTGNGNQLYVRRVRFDGAGVATVGTPVLLTSATGAAALPSVVVASNGTIGILYDTFDGTAADGYPKFSAHLAQSVDHGVTFSQQTLESFEAPDKDNLSDPRQRDFGDYQQLKALGTTFYGVFSGNRAGFSGSVSAIDPVFFQAPADVVATTTTVTPALASTSSQSVALSATVTAQNGAVVNAGTVTFTVTTSGNLPVGTPVTATVVNGSATAAYPLPAGISPGTDSITASYSGSAAFGASSGAAPLTMSEALFKTYLPIVFR